jgi:DNA ligase (NAD+)
MISLDNTYNDEELADFDERVKRSLGVSSEKNLDYTIEYKFD